MTNGKLSKLKGWTLVVITQNNYLHKTWLGNELWERLMVWNIVRNGSLWIHVVFEQEVIFLEFDFETSELDLEVSKLIISKHTTLCDKGVFGFIILQLRRPYWAQHFHRFVMLCICWEVENHQVRRLVSDNNQKCPMSLTLFDSMEG